jgi:hypothetical protein
VSPLSAFDFIRVSDHPVYVRLRRCTHGDLNATNIALDDSYGHVDAFVFDAEGVHSDVDVRDWATLEVTTLLHHALEGNESLVDGCADLYSDFVIPPQNVDFGSGPPLLRNTRKLIAEIRTHALRFADESVYASVVFDVAILQLGGLIWQAAGNKIVVPKDAATLAALTAGWCMRITGITNDGVAKEQPIAEVNVKR